MNQFFTTLTRILSQTLKQIRRSGWLAWASILVMSLAMFIAIIFVGLAYGSNLFLQSIENEPHIYVFFGVGADDEKIQALNSTWSQMSEIELIEYTSENEALEEFKTSQERTNPQVAENIRTNVLPASLGIRLYKIQDADKIIDMVTTEQTENEDIVKVLFNKDTIDTIKALFYWLRLGGGIIMGLLLLVIFAFTLLTVEFRTYSRAEEIGIMQLVGGSLWFIRSPFIFEGAFYGMIGAFLSTSIIYSLSYFIFVVNRESSTVNFLMNFFGDLRWPSLDPIHYIAGFFCMLILGVIIGAINSFVAIKRYIN